MIQPTKWRSSLLLLLAASLGVGSVVLFAFWPLGTLRIVRPQWSEVKLLAWEIGRASCREEFRYRWSP